MLAGQNKKVFDAHEYELHLVEEHLRGMFQSNAFYIPLIGKHLLDSGGKRLRPLFLILSARLAGYNGQDHIALAGVIEAIHTASLLHDDVVDGADMRRGRPSAHSLWSNQLVILVGDFLYSNALRHAVSFKSQRIMETLSKATTKMTEGELLQLQKSGDTEITEAEYIDIITAKTAGLISAACRIGAILSGCAPPIEEALSAFGLKAGLAFQIVDDILDYMAEEGDLGKRLGRDLDEGKITLPLICLLRAVTGQEKQELTETITGGLSDEGLKKVIGLFSRYDVLDEAMGYAGRLVAEAKSGLMVFPPSALRDELFELADYALQREK